MWMGGTKFVTSHMMQQLARLLIVTQTNSHMTTWLLSFVVPLERIYCITWPPSGSYISECWCLWRLKQILCAKYDTSHFLQQVFMLTNSVTVWQPQSHEHIMASQTNTNTPQSVSVCDAEKNHVKNQCVSMFRMSKNFIQEHGKWD